MVRNAYIVVFGLYSAFHCIRIAQQVSWRKSTPWRVRFDRLLAVKLFLSGKKQDLPGKVAGCFHLRRASTANVTFAQRNKTSCSKFRRSRSSVRPLVYYGEINPLSPELNPICYLLTLLAHDFLHVSRIRVKSLTLRLLLSYIYIYIYIYGAPILYVSRSHTTTQHNR
jgi:hypothetical protein